MRQKIEKVVDDGFTFAHIFDRKPSPKEIYEKRIHAMSPIEKIYDERKELIEKREKEIMMRAKNAYIPPPPPPPPAPEKLKPMRKGNKSLAS